MIPDHEAETYYPVPNTMCETLSILKMVAENVELENLDINIYGCDIRDGFANLKIRPSDRHLQAIVVGKFVFVLHFLCQKIRHASNYFNKSPIHYALEKFPDIFLLKIPMKFLDMDLFIRHHLDTDIDIISY